MAFSQGQTAWDGVSVPGFFDSQQSASDPMINVWGASYSWDWWAQTTGSCSGGTWYSAETTMRFNSRTMGGGLDSFKKKVVATHELGHAYGLNHTPETCGSTKGVMQQHSTKFTCGSTPPWQDDIDGVNGVY